jgi:hypothetical protein
VEDVKSPGAEDTSVFTPLQDARFDEEELRFKAELWRILVDDLPRHNILLSYLSMAEALELSGLRVEKLVPRSLPYTVKDRRLPHSGFLVRAH